MPTYTGSPITSPTGSYCTTADIKAQLPESGLATDTSYDTMLGTLITTASRLIDREVGRWPKFFYPSTDAETRYFDGDGSADLWTDEFISVPSIGISEEGGLASSDYTTLSSSDYILWPYNTGTGKPYYRVMMDTLNGSYLEWPKYHKGVKLTTVFGYSVTPPEEIKQATIIQTIRWFMKAKAAFTGAGASAEVGQPAIGALDADVKMLIQSFKVANMTEVY